MAHRQVALGIHFSDQEKAERLILFFFPVIFPNSTTMGGGGEGEGLLPKPNKKTEKRRQPCVILWGKKICPLYKLQGDR